MSETDASGCCRRWARPGRLTALRESRPLGGGRVAVARDSIVQKDPQIPVTLLLGSSARESLKGDRDLLGSGRPTLYEVAAIDRLDKSEITLYEN